MLKAQKTIIRYGDRSTGIEAKEAIIGTVPIHWHTYYELELVSGPSALHIVNGTAVSTPPYYASLMTPRDFHQYVIPNRDVLFRKILFQEDSISPELKKTILSAKTPLSLSLTEEQYASLSNIISAIIRLQEKQLHDIETKLLIRNMAERVLIDLLCIKKDCRTADPPVIPFSSDNPLFDLNAALLYISDHFTERITLSGTAAVVHMSPAYFSRYFSRSIGVTFCDYVKNKRIRYACTLLSTDMTLEEIALSAGFSSTSFFYHVFRSTYCMTPAEYRRRYV